MNMCGCITFEECRYGSYSTWRLLRFHFVFSPANDTHEMIIVSLYIWEGVGGEGLWKRSSSLKWSVLLDQTIGRYQLPDLKGTKHFFSLSFCSAMSKNKTNNILLQHKKTKPKTMNQYFKI